jgi:thiol-disulfide isomerase/thioredoxin
MVVRRVVVAALLLLSVACGRQPSQPLAEFLHNKQAAVFVFLAPDCPLSQSYTKTLNELRGQFLNSAIEFYGVFTADSGVNDFVATYRITFPIVLDRDFSLADRFGAANTPEVFAVDSAGRTFYQGAIDNGAPELGQHRTVITERYLFDALSAFVRHEDVKIKQTRAVGCFIERVK